MDELIQQIAAGGPFDTIDAIRAIARKLMAPVTADVTAAKTLPEANTNTTEPPKKKRPDPGNVL